MSYDVRINGVKFKEPHQLRGGTFALGGTTDAWLNVTYNYARHYARVIGPEGLEELNGKKVMDTLPLLRQAVAMLKDDETEDYWEPTEGNARAALLDLIQLAEMAGRGTWDIR